MWSLQLSQKGGQSYLDGPDEATALKRWATWSNGAIMMARAQITLDPETERRARERAADLGMSFAEYVRTLVERDLTGPSRNSDPSVVFDLGRSNTADVARDKDAMLGAAVEAERSRESS